MKNFACTLLLVLLVTWSTSASCQQWRVIEFQWKGKQATIGKGTLNVKLDKETRAKPDTISEQYSFVQYLQLTRPARSILVSPCSIVSNLDTNGGYAGALLEKNGKKFAVYMNQSTTFLDNPRVCLTVYY